MKFIKIVQGFAKTKFLLVPFLKFERLLSESPTSDSESGSNGSCNQFIAAQAIKVSLPGAVEQKSSFTDESLDLFRSEVFRQKVKLKLHNPRSVHSPDPNECVVWKLSQPANCDESSECIEMDLLQICISKGIINIMGCRLPGKDLQLSIHSLSIQFQPV